MVQQGGQRGFTLQELMISVAIFFILTAIGVPSYITFVRNSARDDTTAKLFSDIYYARSEAVKTKTKVILCRSDDVTVSSPGCSTGVTANNDWTAGWIVYRDVNGNGVYDNGTDILLKIGDISRTGIQVWGNNKAATDLAFDTDGSLATGFAPAQFAVCDDRGANSSLDTSTGQYISIGAMGRPEVTFIRNNSTQTCKP